jgi:hypothetical protein
MPGALSILGKINVCLDQIINAGQIVWGLYEANVGTINLYTASASAIPCAAYSDIDINKCDTPFP